MVSSISALILFHIRLLAARMSLEDQYSYQAPIPPGANPLLTFSETWSVLGPFQIGTREAPWGSDPLEYHGGFPNLKYEDGAKFRSSLASNGTVSWSTTRAKSIQSVNNGSRLSLSITFPDVDWTFLKAVYGWSSLQWQAWARGDIMVNSDKPVDAALYTDHLLEYALDGSRHFGGDFYAFRKAPLVVHLSPGRHVLDLRFIRDVRAMGGIGQPTVDVVLEIIPTSAQVELGENKVLASDVVDGFLSSPFASIPLRNNGQDWIDVFKIADAQRVGDLLDFELLEDSAKSIAPGQTRPIPFRICVSDNSITASSSREIVISYRSRSNPDSIGSVKCVLELHSKTRYDPHKVTHLHAGGIVSYAILRPPSKSATCPVNSTSYKAPVMLQLHGAGLEADSDLVAHALDPLPDLCAWVLFPTGVTPWSADDWHNWGFTDVEAAISNILSWIENVSWNGIGVDISKWLVGGHSNGGQGAWYTLLHHPDRVIAASPVSGYLSIHEYVPYNFWRLTEPKKRAIIEAAANSYRHELLVSNAKGIPIQQQHGSADDNVPAYHSRLMSQLLSETGWLSNYSEIVGRGHWWDGVMTTKDLSKFYQEQLLDAYIKRDVPSSFELAVANPGDTSSKFGLQIMYLLDPAQLGKVAAICNSTTGKWHLELHNVLAFQWSRDYMAGTINIDGKDVTIVNAEENEVEKHFIIFWKSEENSWVTTKPDIRLRQRSHLGGMDAILRTKGAISIIFDGNETFPVALQLSRNLFQYFYADSELAEASAQPPNSSGNRILVILGAKDSTQLCNVNSPLSICFASPDNTSPMISARKGSKYPVKFGSSSGEVGALFVRPSRDLSDNALELVIWGSTPDMLAQVARMAPLMTGTGQPDFIVMDKTARWRGVDGAALGFFDAKWEISDAVGFT